MSKISFEEDQYPSRQILAESTTPKMVVWLIRHKIVSSENHAHKLLVFVASLFLLMSFAIFFRESLASLFTPEPEISLEQQLQRERWNERREARGLPPLNN